MKAAAAILACVLLAGCDESMDEQNRLKTYGPADMANWPAPGEALPLPAGTVAEGTSARERDAGEPPLVSPALLQRGRERYDIYCSPCHGLSGDGDGIVVARGFPKPAAFDDPRLMGASAKHLADVIARGYGTMYSFSDRVEPKDRWAIVAYIRALQWADGKADAK